MTTSDLNRASSPDGNEVSRPPAGVDGPATDNPPSHHAYHHPPPGGVRPKV